jgi:hypothetical protein
LKTETGIWVAEYVVLEPVAKTNGIEMNWRERVEGNWKGEIKIEYM